MKVSSLLRRSVCLFLVALLAGAVLAQVSGIGVPPRPAAQAAPSMPMSEIATPMPPPYPPWP